MDPNFYSITGSGGPYDAAMSSPGANQNNNSGFISITAAHTISSSSQQLESINNNNANFSISTASSAVDAGSMGKSVPSLYFPSPPVSLQQQQQPQSHASYSFQPNIANLQQQQQQQQPQSSQPPLSTYTTLAHHPGGSGGGASPPYHQHQHHHQHQQMFNSGIIGQQQQSPYYIVMPGQHQHQWSADPMQLQPAATHIATSHHQQQPPQFLSTVPSPTTQIFSSPPHQQQQQHMVMPSPPTTTGYHPGIHETTGPMIIGGRLRHGGNAHTELKHACKYFAYRDADAVASSNFSQAPSQPGPKDQILPLFVQMFPSEHKDQAGAIFEKVLLLICGPGAGCVVGVEPRSDTSFIVFVRSSVVWHLIYNLRYRVLMDRHGFWYAENLQQYAVMREYCDNVRTLPQQPRHAKTDGMPSMPLVIELSRTMSRTSITAPPAPAPFDIQVSASSSGGNQSSLSLQPRIGGNSGTTGVS